MGDLYSLENVFSNIINNAIKFSNKNKNIYIIIDSSLTSNPNVMDISISITDEGYGIEQEKLDNIFNNELHSRPVHLNIGQGTGLGLYFCKSIVELHGGKIEINSKVEKGTQVKITIPFTVVKMINYNIKSERLLSCQSSHSLFNTVAASANIIVLDSPHYTPKPSFTNKKRLQNISEEDLNSEKIIQVEGEQMEQFEQKGSDCGDGDIKRSNSECSDEINQTNTIVEYTETSSQHKEELTERNFTSYRIQTSHSGMQMYKNSEKLYFLIVDDSELNCKMIIMLLHKFGIKSQYVENGKLAINKVLRKIDGFDVIMMDNLMPVMNGTEAAQIIRREGYKGLIIGITGNVMEKEKADFVNAGADIVLSKPIKIDTLKMIFKFIEKNGCISKFDEKMIIIIDNGVMEWSQKSLDNIV